MRVVLAVDHAVVRRGLRSLLETEPGGVVGGRPRRLAAPASEAVFDNGQHLLLGAYQSCLQLMRQVGANPDALLWRVPQRLEMAGEFCLAPASLPAPRGPPP